MIENVPSETLQILLKFAKGPYYNGVGTEKGLFNRLRQVLSDSYGTHINDRSVIEIVLRNYIECVSDSRFELGRNLEDRLREVIIAPISGIHAIDWPYSEMSKLVTFEQFYEAQLAHMLSNMVVARVDWLPKEIYERVRTLETQET